VVERGAITRGPGLSVRDSLAKRLGASLALLGIIAGALLLRLHNLDQWGLWDDELFSVKHALEPFNFLGWQALAWVPHRIWFELAGVDVASLDPKQIWTWRAAGITEWTMRAPVALLGALTIAVLWFVSRRTLGVRPTLWLCLLLAFSPWHLWMSQVSRFYMQLFLLYNLALLLYYQATMEGSRARAGAAMACMVLAFYTSQIALMIVAVLGADIAMSWLRRRPTGMRPAFWAMGIAAIAICMVAVLRISGAGSEQFALRIERYAEFKGTPQSIAVMTMGMVYLIGVPMVVMAALGLWALFQRNERFAILLAAASVVPLAVFIGLNLLGKDTHVRYTFVALFAWLTLAAIGIEVTVAALRWRWGYVVGALPGVALLATFALDDYIYMTGGAGYRPLWREATAYVQAHRRPGELVGGDWAGLRMIQYYMAEPEAVFLPHGFSDHDMHELVPRPAWILLHSYHASSGDRTEELSAAGALQAYFTNRIAQPNHTINVYYYTPPGLPEPSRTQP
jgi:Dolichyl-phosphate-mannose-protein mannosyltransferase